MQFSSWVIMIGSSAHGRKINFYSSWNLFTAWNSKNVTDCYFHYYCYYFLLGKNLLLMYRFYLR